MVIANTAAPSMGKKNGKGKYLIFFKGRHETDLLSARRAKRGCHGAGVGHRKQEPKNLSDFALSLIFPDGESE